MFLSRIFENPNSVLNAAVRRQLLAVITVDIMTFAHGIATGWVSPTLLNLQSNESPLDFSVSVNESSWIGSLQGLGSVFGNILAGIVLNLFGRKLCMYLLAIPHILLWILVYFAQNVKYLYISRFFAGLSSGSYYVVFPIFISEIANSNIRGTLGCSIMLSFNFGILFGFIMACNLNYYVMPLIIVFLPIFYLIFVTFFPETPQYLLSKKKIIEAEKSHKFYKNFKTSKNNDKENQKFKESFQELLNIATQANNKETLSYKDFFTRPALKAFLTAAILIFTNQFSGIYTFSNYMTLIFSKSGTNIDPKTCTIIMGMVQILGSYTGTVLVDICGRKLLYLLSCACTAIGLIFFGLFTFYNEDGGLSQYDWILIVIMAFVIFSGNLGIMAVIFIIIVEIFPVKIRSITTSICTVYLSFMVFLILKIFPVLMDLYGIPITMWFLALLGILPGFIYLFIFLPETKGKSMNE